MITAFLFVLQVAILMLIISTEVIVPDTSYSKSLQQSTQSPSGGHVPSTLTHSIHNGTVPQCAKQNHKNTLTLSVASASSVTSSCTSISSGVASITVSSSLQPVYKNRPWLVIGFCTFISHWKMYDNICMRFIPNLYAKGTQITRIQETTLFLVKDTLLKHHEADRDLKWFINHVSWYETEILYSSFITQ